MRCSRGRTFLLAACALSVVGVLAIALLHPVLRQVLAYSLTEPPIYYGERIQGRVVDGVSGEPLPAVAVSVIWKLAESDTKLTLFHLDATQSGPDGRYELGSWGPRLRWPPWNGMSEYEPTLLFFKPGYLYERRSNRALPGERGMTRQSEWDGKDVDLLKASSRDRYAASLVDLTRYHVEPLVREDCAWEAVADLVRRVVGEVHEIAREGLWPGATPMERWAMLAQQARCSHLEVFDGGRR